MNDTLLYSRTINKEDKDRRKHVDNARERWRRNLIDFTRRNPLLYYRSQSIGTLEFNQVEKRDLQELLSGKSTNIYDIFPNNQHQSVLRKIKQIHKRALANREDKGIETLFLAIGRVTWNISTIGRPPAAPILLLPMEISITARGNEVLIRRAGNPRINDVLLYALAQEHRRTSALDLLNDDNDDEVESVMGYLGGVIKRLRACSKSQLIGRGVSAINE
jgi:hypothetical protein